MKIASIYDFTAYPPKGGNHVHALQLIRCFLREGHDVLTWGDPSVPGVKSYPRDDDGGRALLADADILYVRVDANFFGADAALVRLLQQASRPQVWEINAPANEALAFSWLGGQRTPHSGLRGVVDRARRSLHAARKASTIREEEGLRELLAGRVAAATCVSAALGRYAQEGLGIRDVTVIPNGADHEACDPNGMRAVVPEQRVGHLLVLYAGSPMYPWQGLDVMQEAAALCAAANDPIQFLLLMNQAPKRPMAGHNVISRIGVPHGEVDNYLRAADVGLAIYPEYFWSPWGFHNSPMKMFEYMACGLPVVASDLGQMREVIEPGRNGLLFDNTPAGLRTALLGLVGKTAQLRAMGVQARADVERTYNWPANARRTLAVLERAMRPIR